MREAFATITSNGQITLPAAILKHLGVGERDTVAFVVGEDGTVHVRPVTFPTIASLQGVAGTLPRPMAWDEVVEIAREDGISAARAPEGDETLAAVETAKRHQAELLARRDGAPFSSSTELLDEVREERSRRSR